MDDYFDERVFERSQPDRQCAFELPGCDSRLILSLGVDDIANCLGLCEVDTFVQESAKGELTGLGDARSAINRQLKHAPENDRAAVATDLHYVLAGVRVR